MVDAVLHATKLHVFNNGSDYIFIVLQYFLEIEQEWLFGLVIAIQRLHLRYKVDDHTEDKIAYHGHLKSFNKVGSSGSHKPLCRY
jgi:hypothetical protein